MKWKVKLSSNMATQVSTKPSGSFDTKAKAESWGNRTYGSGTFNIKLKGKQFGWCVVKA